MNEFGYVKNLTINPEIIYFSIKSKFINIISVLEMFLLYDRYEQALLDLFSNIVIR